MERKWWTLLAVSVATFMLLLDITVVNTALPAIQKDLSASFTDLQWVIDAYTLALAAVVLTAGSIADRIGRRAVFVAGLGIFAASSLAAGLAPDATFLNISRAVEGIGGAAMFAVSLALVAQEFAAGRERATAMGIYGATIGAAVAVGPLVGGAITDSLGWRWVFFLNVRSGSPRSPSRSRSCRSRVIPTRPASTGPGSRRSAHRCCCWCWDCCAATTTVGRARRSCRC